MQTSVPDVDVSPKLRELSDFYVTNVITRASQTMSEAKKAAQQNKENPFVEQTQFYRHA